MQTFILDSNGEVVASGNPFPVTLIGGGGGGTAQTDESAFLPGVGAGTPIMGFDAVANEVVALAVAPGTRQLEVSGSFSSSPPTSSTSSAVAQQSIAGSSIQILAANVLAKGRSVQNTGTVTVYLGLGRTPTTSAYHIALAPGGNANDGSGARWDGTISGVLWQGVVNAITASASTVVATELS